MTEVKEAVRLAAQALDEICEPKPKDVLLEEVELSEDGKFWCITFSFNAVAHIFDVYSQLLAPKREYKVICIDAETGKFQSMKIRKVA